MTETKETIDLSFLARQNEKILAELAAMRRETSDVRHLTLATADYLRRFERRVSELKDDVELMLKSELMGWAANFETRLDSKLFDLVDERLRHELPTKMADAVREALKESKI